MKHVKLYENFNDELFRDLGNVGFDAVEKFETFDIHPRLNSGIKNEIPVILQKFVTSRDGYRIDFDASDNYLKIGNEGSTRNLANTPCIEAHLELKNDSKWDNEQVDLLVGYNVKRGDEFFSNVDNFFDPDKIDKLYFWFHGSFRFNFNQIKDMFIEKGKELNHPLAALLAVFDELFLHSVNKGGNWSYEWDEAS